MTVPPTDLSGGPGPTGNGGSTYTAGVDPSNTVGGVPAELLSSTSATATDSSGYAYGYRAVDPSWPGKRVEMTAQVKTDSATLGYVYLMFASDSGAYVEDDMLDPVNRAITGTTDWHQVSIVLDVPPDATEVSYGSALSGTGKIWIGPMTFTIVGSDVPQTPHFYGGESP